MPCGRLGRAWVAVGIAAGFVLTAAASEADPPVRLVLLGTAGGPTPKKLRAAPSQAIVVGGDVYVIDCGNGVARQMALAGIRTTQLRAIFLTHHHSDHAADLVTLPLLAWAAGLERPVELHGPPPLGKALRAGVRAHAFDAETRREDEGRAPFRETIRPREFRRDGEVYRDERVTVTAARVEHPPIRDAYAYRFDVEGWSVVVSGDTAPSENLVRLAKGADVLVHEVLLHDAAAVSAWIGKPVHHPLVRHIVRSHTSVREVGRVARDAGVRTLVLSHFVPGDVAVDETSALAVIREFYSGEVVFGRDLLEIRPSVSGTTDSAPPR